MTYQHRGGYASNAPWNRSNRLYDRLRFLKVYISAELSFCIYINTYVNDYLTRS